LGYGLVAEEPFDSRLCRGLAVQCGHTGCGTHPTPYAKTIVGIFPVGEAAGLWSWPF